MNIGNYSNIYDIHKNNTCIINLIKTYRSTMEITKFARNILNEEISDEYVEMHGEEPKVICFSEENSMNTQIIEDIKEFSKKKYKSIAIITKTARETRGIISLLNSNNIEAKFIEKDDDEYTSGVIVIPSYLAKGLEFDIVLIYDASSNNYNSEDERLLLYTCCTRALHVLNIYYINEFTPLLRLIG